MACKNTREDGSALVLRNFDSELSKLSDALRDSKSGTPVDRFEASEKIIQGLESGLGVTNLKRHCFLWEGCIDDTRRYLSAVDCILGLIEDRELLSDGELVGRVDGVVQKAMSRLEDEFMHILNCSVVPLDGERLFQRISVSLRRISLSFASNDGASEDFDSSVDDDRDSSSEERRGSLGEDLCIELMNTDAIVDLRDIAERMIRAGYEKECCQVYTTARLEALYQCLAELGVEKLSIEEVLRLDWGVLEDKMKKWIQTIKTVVRFLLVAEKQLCSQIFCCFEQTRDACFTETAKECIMQLLNFGEAVVIVPRSPERLFQILNMYEALANVRVGLKELFSDDLGGFVFTEVEDLLIGLGEASKGTFAEFENAVLTESSRQVTHFADVHPLTRYVMNYIQLLVEYSDTLNLLLKDNTVGSRDLENDGGVPLQLDSTSPIAQRVLPLISSLESNLENKSKLYGDGAIQYVFLMNNILYIVKKAKDSELGKLLGDHWVRRRRSQVRQYATCYLRASLSKVLSFLKDDGLVGSGSLRNISKVALKERFKSFNATFEEIYKCQSAWKVSDPQLRDELRMLISERILPAYRSFVGRFKIHIESVRHSGKYIKYTPEDIENYLLDLFEGSPKDLLYPKRH